jgi:hypothetical protein
MKSFVPSRSRPEDLPISNEYDARKRSTIALEHIAYNLSVIADVGIEIATIAHGLYTEFRERRAKEHSD